MDRSHPEVWPNPAASFSALPHSTLHMAICPLNNPWPRFLEVRNLAASIYTAAGIPNFCSTNKICESLSVVCLTPKAQLTSSDINWLHIYQTACARWPPALSMRPGLIPQVNTHSLAANIARTPVRPQLYSMLMAVSAAERMSMKASLHTLSSLQGWTAMLRWLLCLIVRSPEHILLKAASDTVQVLWTTRILTVHKKSLTGFPACCAQPAVHPCKALGVAGVT